MNPTATAELNLILDFEKIIALCQRTIRILHKDAVSQIPCPETVVLDVNANILFSSDLYQSISRHLRPIEDIVNSSIRFLPID